jgi:hypothetical protein
MFGCVLGCVSKFLEWQDFYALFQPDALPLRHRLDADGGPLVVKCPKNVADGSDPERS